MFIQLYQHIFFSDKTLENLPSEDHFKNGLYMFDIGQNDIAGAIYGKTVDQAAAVIPTIIKTFQDGINVSIYMMSLYYHCCKKVALL